jgi:hypothetical protein
LARRPSLSPAPHPARAAARWLAALAALAAPDSALAVECASLPNPVYGLGGSAGKPLIGKTAAALAGAGSTDTIVYQAPGACFGINGLIAATKITGTASYWLADGTEQSCDLPIAGADVHYANMGNTATGCPGVAALPPDVGDFLGPVQAFTLVVPLASSQQAISSEAAYFVFGFGQTGQAAPWTDESQIFRRDVNSAAQLFIALAAGVPSERFKGVDTKSNAGTITAVSGSPTPEAAIGLVGGEVADANRARVRILAYQHRGQSCGYWPDSTLSSFDKRNVRTGQYAIWAPQHFFAKVDGAGAIVHPGAARYIGYFTGATPAPTGVDIAELSIAAGTVPACAMEVQRQGDFGEVSSYAPAEPCGCFFEKVATGATECAACAGGADAECPANAPHCRHGYCEVN